MSLISLSFRRTSFAFVALIVGATGVAAAAETVTFNKHIAPLVFENCTTCHRAGEVAPFALLNYADVKKHAGQIRTVTESRFMPPWKSVEGHGRFIGERRLKPEQIALIAQWVEQGTPEGNPADLPPVPQFNNEWKLGTPDLVVTMDTPYEIPAEGPDIYRNFVFPVTVPAGKFIRALEYRPGNRPIVHHAVFANDASGKAREKDAADPGPGFSSGLNISGRILPGSMAAWVPGRDAMPLPQGLSLPWPEGGDLIVQLHLHPIGKPQSEKSSIGLYFTDEAPQRSMTDLLLIDKKIDIPPGERAFRTRDEYTLPIEMNLFGIFPHMHLIGHEMKITAYPPQGESFSLLWINDWDFNWQSFYQYNEPVKLPAGTRVVLEGVHDNSAENPRNPAQPPRRVTWGEQTFNEMSLATLQLVPASEADLAQIGDRRRFVGGISPSKSASGTKVAARDPGEGARKAIEKFDADKDGSLNLDELVTASGKPRDEVQRYAARFDVDKNGALNPTELEAAIRALTKQ